MPNMRFKNFKSLSKLDKQTDRHDDDYIIPPSLPSD